MSQQRVSLLNRGLVGTGAVIALALLLSFYFVVSGAVTRAAHKRADWSHVVSDAGSAGRVANSDARLNAHGRGVMLARAVD